MCDLMPDQMSPCKSMQYLDTSFCWHLQPLKKLPKLQNQDPASSKKDTAEARNRSPKTPVTAQKYTISFGKVIPVLSRFKSTGPVGGGEGQTPTVEREYQQYTLDRLTIQQCPQERLNEGE